MMNFIGLLSLFFLTMACSKDVVTLDYGSEKRSILVYMAADNNLSSHAYKNIQAMSNSASSVRNGTLIVYLDTDEPKKQPRLLKITGGKDGYQELKSYPEHNSASKEVFEQVLRDFLKLAPADEYGLVLWSHANGWLPAIPATYTFGKDRQEVMELDDLAAAIPDRLFDFILFDACYMGGIETLYALRNKAPYIISSPAEILAKGFPYHLIVEDMFAWPRPNLIGVCTKYYNHYNSLSGTLRTCTVSLVETEYLDELAAELKALMPTYAYYLARMNLSGIQKFDTYPTPITFDMVNMFERLLPERLRAPLLAILDRAVVYKANTPQFKPTHKDEFDIDRFCGIGTYIPVEQYNPLNAYWAQTQWAKAIGYVYSPK